MRTHLVPARHLLTRADWLALECAVARDSRKNVLRYHREDRAAAHAVAVDVVAVLRRRGFLVRIDRKGSARA